MRGRSGQKTRQNTTQNAILFFSFSFFFPIYAGRRHHHPLRYRHCSGRPARVLRCRSASEPSETSSAAATVAAAADQEARPTGLRGSLNKVVLAYSGGLDTSVAVPWLKENYGCQVVCYTADVGQVGVELWLRCGLGHGSLDRLS